MARIIIKNTEITLLYCMRLKAKNLTHHLQVYIKTQNVLLKILLVYDTCIKFLNKESRLQ